MGDPKNRFNRIVTDTLSLSPHARHTHESYYGSKNRYTYGMKTDATEMQGVAHLYGNSLARNIAALEYNTSLDRNDGAMRVVLHMQYKDGELMRAVNHELIHVQQIINMQDNKIDTGICSLDVDDVLTRVMMMEIHAFVMEQESIIQGFYQTVSNGFSAQTEKKVNRYKEYAAANNESFKSYAAALCHDKTLLGQSVSKVVDQIGYRYLNDVSFREPEEQAKAKTHARKECIKDFLGNTRLVSAYAVNTLNTYDEAWRGYDAFCQGIKNKASAYGTVQNDYLIRQRLRDTALRRGVSDPTIDKISLAFNDQKELFLSASDWKEVLGADNNKDFAYNLTQHAARQEQHKQLQGKLRLDRPIL